MYLLELYYKRRGREVPYFARYSLLKLLWIPVRKTLNVVIIPNIPFNSWRVALYRMIGYKIGKKVFVGMKCYLDDTEPQNMAVADNVTISYGCYFALHGKGQDRSNINIEAGAYIGMRATVIAGERGLTIGRDSTVGAGSLVNRDVPPDVLVAGNPARVLKAPPEAVHSEAGAGAALSLRGSATSSPRPN